MNRQLVFRRELRDPVPLPSGDAGEFRLYHSVVGTFRTAGMLRRRFGLRGFAAALLKVASRKRLYYCMAKNGRIVTDGWVWLGICRRYTVGRDSAVVGMLWTDPAERGKGLATTAMLTTLREMRERGMTEAFIDTSEANTPMRKVIEKCGFGEPIRVMAKEEWEKGDHA